MATLLVGLERGLRGSTGEDTRAIFLTFTLLELFVTGGWGREMDPLVPPVAWAPLEGSGGGGTDATLRGVLVDPVCVEGGGWEGGWGR